MGGLRKYMPITYCDGADRRARADAGIPPFAGFFSKDSIIEAVHEAYRQHAGRGLRATSRCWRRVRRRRSTRSACVSWRSTARSASTEHGPRRIDDARHDDAHGHDDTATATCRTRSPWVVTVPLILLAIPSVVDRAGSDRPMLFGDFFGSCDLRRRRRTTAQRRWREEFHGVLADDAARPDRAAVLACARGRRGSRGSVHRSGPSCRRDSRAKCGRARTRCSTNKYYFDHFNDWFFAGGARLFGSGLWKVGDVAADRRPVVNGARASSAGVPA